MRTQEIGLCSRQILSTGEATKLSNFISLIEDWYCLIELICPQGVIGLALGVFINVDDNESINKQHAGPDDVVMLPET